MYKATDTVYEIRYNENKRYEVNFGDDVNGQKLQKGDSVAVYYLKINDNVQNIGAGGIVDAPIVRFNSLQFSKILEDTGIEYGNYLSSNDSLNIQINNDFPSTDYSSEETVDDIRKNAPRAFRSQYRLVTKSDYEVFVQKNYSNIISDVVLLNNDEYLKQNIKYLYDLGLKNPQEDTKILYNQIKFANSCNFNNLYLYLVPSNPDQEYLTTAQKEFILEGLNEVKTITTQIVPIDPVYVYLDFYLENPASNPNLEDVSQTKIRILKDSKTRRSNSAILLDVKNILQDSFSRENSKLGQLIDIYEIANRLLNIEGIENIQTHRSDLNLTIEGLSFIIWNPIYPDKDIKVFSQNYTVEGFKYPIFSNLEDIADRVEIIELNKSIKIADF
jgi:hypothetical protein